MSSPAIQNYLRAAAASDPTGSSDADLLARFAANRDEDAFELLVWRHAGLVQRVCRSVLRDHHAAEDAAQAAFLVLARKAGSIRSSTVVGWLYRVARRGAVRLAKQRARMPAAVPELAHIPDRGAGEPADRDDLAALCTEIDRLPEHYRVPVLLCFLEGLTHAEAAERTGWPVGTVAGRLARAKEVLARRLRRHGIGVPAFAIALPSGAFVGPTAQAAAAFAQRRAIVPSVDPTVPQLAEGVIQAMTTIPLKLTAAAALLLCSLAAGLWAAGGREAVRPIVTTAVAAPAPKAAHAHPVCTVKQRDKSLNNLKHIMLGFHNYSDANAKFPADVVDKNGKPLLSWRVLLLPYIEQEQLYRQFKLDEPWDSANNKKLLAQMPDIYRVVAEQIDATKTYYQGFAGPQTIFEPGKRLSFQSVTDGTSNTISVVEAGPPVEWTKPADIAYNPKKALPNLDGPFRNTLNCATTDGAAWPLKRDLDEKTLRSFIERDDGTPTPNLKDLKARFALTKEEIETIQGALSEREKTVAEIAMQLREHQKLIVQLGERQNAANAAGLDLPAGLNIERIGQILKDLDEAHRLLNEEIEALRKDVKAEKK